MSASSIAILEDVKKQLLSRGLKMTTAESCTGGWLAQQVTSLAGSSEWFDCGFVTYSNSSKQNLLGVNPATLKEHGAVSEQTAIEMARGALDRADADVAISVTGIAGPDGGTPDKPVGTVWIAWVVPERPPVARCFHFDGDREMVRLETVRAAFAGLLELIVA
jgi:nicotinamide-nucleotide amidase